MVPRDKGQENEEGVRGAPAERASRPWASRRLSRWAEIRLRGRRAYVIRHGVLGWGVFTAVLVSTIQTVAFSEPWAPTLAISLVLYPLTGIMFGRWLWASTERDWRKAQAARRESLRKVF